MKFKEGGGSRRRRSLLQPLSGKGQKRRHRLAAVLEAFRKLQNDRAARGPRVPKKGAGPD
jgi:hypothetical protein